MLKTRQTCYVCRRPCLPACLSANGEHRMTNRPDHSSSREALDAVWDGFLELNHADPGNDSVELEAPGEAMADYLERWA